MPTKHVLDIARTWLASSDHEKRRAIAKALIDVTKEARTVQRGLADNGNVDLAPYFDFWMGDAVSAANELLNSNDENDRTLAQCLIDQEKAIIKSKADFLAEMKRQGIQPKND
jgi:hypothetical protein